jgi:hypothetical protein
MTRPAAIDIQTATVVPANTVAAGDVVRLPGRPGNEAGTIAVDHVLDYGLGQVTIGGVNHHGERIAINVGAAANIYRA